MTVSPVTTRVVNLRHEKADVRIDRRSRWGNPYVIGRPYLGWDAITRDQAISLYRDALVHRIDEDPQFLEPLRGKTLGCWCKPSACHGDVIVEVLAEAGLEAAS